MKQHTFNAGWSCHALGDEAPPVPVRIPHDAMLSEPRGEDSPGKHNIGWFACRDYEYIKCFTPPEEWQEKTAVLEFEGVYHNAEVWLNGEKLSFWPYGYSNFYVELTGRLNFGVENELKVIARNADQPNTRWYSGAGIYRPVALWLGDREHIVLDGIKIRTLQLEPAVVEVSVQTSHPGPVKVEVVDDDGSVAANASGESGGTFQTTLTVPHARLWSWETPELYICRVTYAGETAEVRFGVRTLSWGEEQGFAMNGKRVILRGACIHHDNGFLGATCDPEAVERKVRILREGGYNAIRSAHNPCSKTLLDVCDRLGMLVMDEFVDCWYIHKTKHDYVDYFQDWWQKDLAQMVAKDYNHPCVIMYCTGNEVSETAQSKGIQLTKQITDYLHRLDPTRAVTCGINIFFNFLSSMGFGVYSDEKAEQAAAKPAPKAKKQKAVGSEFFNVMTEVLGDKVMKIGATLPPCDWKTKDAFANMDIAGYNYGIFRYKHDLKKYPHRLIVGSETFCQDAYDFWELAKQEPRLIGDFVWAGMDYIGETGTGRWDYLRYDGTPDKQDSGWLSSGAGRINILGRPTAEMDYTKVAFELEPGPIIAVRPVLPEKKPPVCTWNLTDALKSWSWPGGEGKPAEVEVYARGAKVELYINEKLVGSKRLRNSCRAVFRTTYQSGTIRAVSYDETGAKLHEASLRSAAPDTVLQVRPERNSVKPEGLCYVHLRYADAEGVWKPTENHTVSVTADGGTLLGLGTAANYNPEGYQNTAIATFWGETMAIVRANEAGSVRIAVTDGEREVTLEVPITSED